jgi:hypothetical protein
MSVREYIGARYVPMFANPAEWDATKTYEPLTVVLYHGNSYTSRQAVPANISIENDTYWAQTGNYNAQVEQYRSEVQTFDGRITTNETDIATNAAAIAANATDIDALETILPKADFSATNTVKKYVDDSVAEVQDDIDALLPSADFSATNTVKKYVDDTSYTRTYLNPDWFAGSDYEKLQACIDYAQTNRVRNIIIARSYDITGHTIMVNLPENEGIRTLLRLHGGAQGEIVKRDSGYMFDSVSGVLSHGLTIENLHITSANKSADVFNDRNIIRITSAFCYYYNCHNVFDGCDVNGITVCQSIRSINNSYIRCHAVFESNFTITDCTFINDIAENHCDYGFLFFANPSENPAIIGLNIANCVIEGTDVGGIYFMKSTTHYVQPASVHIEGCYFEGNTGGGISIAGHCNSVNISNCSFSNANTTHGIIIDASQFSENTKIIIDNVFNSGFSTAEPLMQIDNSGDNRYIEFNGYNYDYVIVPQAVAHNVWFVPTISNDYYKQTSTDGTFASRVYQGFPSETFNINDFCMLLTVYDSNDYSNFAIGIFTVHNGNSNITKIASNGMDFGANNAQGTFVMVGNASEYTAYIKLISQIGNQVCA